MSLLLNPNQNQNINDLKRLSDSMSEKIKQNQKQKALFQNNGISNITSGINTEKGIMSYKNNNINNNNLEELNINNNINNINNNNSYLIKNASQSSLSVDLYKYRINPNEYNNSKRKLKNENFETFNPVKDNIISINNSNENFYLNNINNENNLNEKKNIENKDSKKIMSLNSFLEKNFNPYDIKNFLGDKAPQKKTQKKKITLVNNIPPSTSNLQMILYNRRIENMNNQNNPDFLFKNFYQKESRRMLVEYLKINKSYNVPIRTLMKNENIHNLVLLKNKNDDENNNDKNENNEDNNSYFDIKKEKENNSFSKSDMSKNKELTENVSKSKLKSINSFKMLSTFLNDINDESQEKTLLVFLSIPRILRLISSGEKLSYIFCSSPTNISCIYGIETYIFKWSDCKNYNLIGYFDLINVENCYVNIEDKKKFEIFVNVGKRTKNENNKVNDDKYYSIETNDEEITQNYVQAINFVSQLIKYRVYLKQKKEGKLKNYNF